MKQKLIGILAGMGPRSTAPFLDLVVTQCQIQYGAREVDDFPPMLVYSLPAPIYVDKPLDHHALKLAIINGLKKLEAAGVDFIAMPCNTAHIYYDDLAAAIGIPLLNIIDEALKALPRSSAKVTLLATRHTIQADLYQGRLDRAGLSCVLEEAWQSQVDELITTIESSADTTLQDRMWKHLVSQIAAAGVDTILLACTDLNVVSKNTPDDFFMLDATRSLAEAVVREFLSPT
jgi:amino-acid racemase